MPRWSLALLGLVVAAGATWFLLPERSELAPGPELEAQALAEADEVATPRLVGVGEGSTPPPAPNEGRFSTTGMVVDAVGKPLSGIVVEVRSKGPWPRDGGYYASARYFVDKIHHSVRRLTVPSIEGPPDREVMSDDEGRFVFRTDEPGWHAIRARVDPPRTSTTDSVALFENAFLANPVIRVLEGSSLAGRVVDGADRPVPAHVHGSWESKGLGSWSAHTSTDATTGTFTFDAAPLGEITFGVQTAQGSYERLAVRTLPTDGPVLLRIPGGDATLEGLVHTAEGTPVPGALVRVEMELADGLAGDDSTAGEPKLRMGTQSRSDGSVYLEGVPAGHVYGLSVAAEGYRAMQLYRGRAWTGIHVPAGKATSFDVTLSRGSTVQGRVLRREDEDPIPGATVTLYFLGWHPPQEEVVTADDEGRYRFEGLGRGKFLLLPSHATHYCPHLAEALDPLRRQGTVRQTPVALSLELEEEDAVLERDLVLVGGSRIAGHVEDPEGRSVAGAGVFVKGCSLADAGFAWGLGGLSAGEGGQAAASDAEGRFEVDGLPPGDGWVLFARKPGFAGSYADPVAVEARSNTEGVVLRLVEGCVMRGHVYDESGDPIAGQSVFVGGWTELRGADARVWTDAVGAFAIDSLPATPLTLSAQRRNGMRAELKVTDLTPGEVREGLALSFGTGLEVSGTVVDQHGKPAASLPIFVQRRDGTQGERSKNTDANGTFTFRNVRAGKVQVRTYRGGAWHDLGEVLEVPATDLRLVFERPDLVRIEGTVVGPDGEPIPQCTVEAQSSDGRTARAGGNGRVANGVFRVEIRGKPPYDVMVRRPVGRDGQPLNLHGGHARVTDPSTPVAIRLERAYELRGRVVSEEGKPVPGARIHTQGKSARSDLDGSWRLVGLAAGRVALRVDPPFAFMPPPLVVADEGQQDVLIRLAEGVMIAGRVVVPEGVTLRGGKVTGGWPARTGRSQGRVEGRLSPSGTFRLMGVPPGVRVDVRIQPWRGGDGAPVLAPVLVEGVEPGTEGLEVHLDAGVTLSGRVVDARGAPLGEGHVSARGRAGTGWARLDAEGRFRMEGLRPGTYRAFATNAEGFHSPALEVTAPAADVRIALPDMGTLGGRLLGADGEGGWEVQVVDPETGPSPPSSQPAGVLQDGSWTLGGIPVGRAWVVIARATGGDDRYARSGPVEAGRDDIELALEEGRRIAGYTQRAGRSLPRCWVRATAPGWQSYASSDGEGRFVLRGLPPGRYALRAGSWEVGVAGQRTGVDAGAEDVIVALDQDED